MDQLFVNFLNEVESFIQLAESAQKNLTEKAILKGEPTASMLDKWHFMLNKTKESYGKIKMALQSEVSGENAKLIDSELGFFRSLGRWFEEIPCIWSTNYDAIRSIINKFYLSNIHIDRKYHMGQHRDKN